VELVTVQVYSRSLAMLAVLTSIMGSAPCLSLI